MSQISLIHATSTEHYQIAAVLFGEYGSSLGFDLGFQNFAAELTNLPGDYAAPDGCILLALVDGNPAGCVALRRFAAGVCEMKRMYVKPQFRGEGIGKILAEAIINQARGKGYQKMRLDTISTMEAAVRLYKIMEFKEIEPYRYNPIEGAKYFELDLNENQQNQKRVVDDDLSEL